jgi:hypothetical protein
MAPIVPPPNVADQIGSGLASTGALGIGLGGLAVIAVLLLLLLLIKRKKDKRTEIEEEEITVEETSTIHSDAMFISEYGLSDDNLSVEDSEDQEDLPRSALYDGNYGSDLNMASENNPEDLDDDTFSPDEA